MDSFHKDVPVTSRDYCQDLISTIHKRNLRENEVARYSLCYGE